MAKLQNPMHEALARGRSLGARLEDAYEDAGYVASRAHACRLAAQPEVSERISELRLARSSNVDTSPQAVVDALFRMARDSEVLKTPPRGSRKHAPIFWRRTGCQRRCR